MIGLEISLATLTNSTIKMAGQLIADKLIKAREDYQETIITTDTASPTEIKRSKLLGDLSELQAKIMLYISRQAELMRLLAILADLSIQTYEAKTEQELKLVELSLNGKPGLTGGVA